MKDIKIIKTMRKLLKITFIIAVASFLTSCEKEESTNVYTGEPFISFGTSLSGSTLENIADPVTITAYASVPNLSADITVGFEITEDNGSPSNYTVVDNKAAFTFGKDKYTDTIQIIPVDNNEEDGNKTLTITLTSSSGGETIGLPGPDGNSKSFTITIEDNDCKFSLKELGEATWVGTDNVPSGEKGPNTSLITANFEDPNLLLEGIGYAWITDTDYWNEVVVESNPVITTIDPITFELIIEKQYLCTTIFDGNNYEYYIQAKGVYSSCSEKMIINYDLIQDDKITRSFTETITIQ